MHEHKKYDDIIFQKRFESYYEELYKLYTDLYHNDSKFDLLVDMIYDFYQNRSKKLKILDEERVKTPNWYCKNDSIVIQLYTEKFAGTIKGIEEKLDYLQKLGIKYIYALPFFDHHQEKVMVDLHGQIFDKFVKNWEQLKILNI